MKMDNKFSKIYKIMKKHLLGSRIFFALIFAGLLLETGISLAMPQMISVVIDNLETQTVRWLACCTLLFCATVVLRGGVSVLNTYLSEATGWKMCDYLREDMFRHIFSYSVSRHKAAKAGFFLERIEGDINILVGFFSNMFIDIFSSLLMVVGILIVFFQKSVAMGAAFTAF